MGAAVRLRHPSRIEADRAPDERVYRVRHRPAGVARRIALRLAADWPRERWIRSAKASRGS